MKEKRRMAPCAEGISLQLLKRRSEVCSQRLWKSSPLRSGCERAAWPPQLGTESTGHRAVLPLWVHSGTGRTGTVPVGTVPAEAGCSALGPELGSFRPNHAPLGKAPEPAVPSAFTQPSRCGVRQPVWRVSELERLKPQVRLVWVFKHDHF